MEFLKELEFAERKMEKVGRKTIFKTEIGRPYQVFERGGVHVIQTLQGFWHRALLWAARNGLHYELVDLRAPDLLRDPRFDLMHGFRFNQREFVETGLLRGYSGMMGAPTRYGKSTCLLNILRAYPTAPAVVLAPGKTLLKQTLAEMRDQIPDREVKLIGGGSTVKYQSDDITIVSMDSVHKIDKAAVRLVLVDEPHAIASAGRIGHVPGFHLARKIALGATLKGRYDGRDAMLEGIFGPILSEVTYREAVDMGAVCQIKVPMIQIPIRPEPGNRERIYKSQYLENDRLMKIVADMSNRLIPKEDQTLMFIKQEKQGRRLLQHVGEHVPLVMDKVLTSKERDAITEAVEKNHVARVVCSDIFVQGVTFHDIRYLINTSGGGPGTTALQRPGRLAEIRPDKRFGVMADFQHVLAPKRPGQPPRPDNMGGVKALVREARQRAEVYAEVGYHVDEVHPDQLENWMKDHNTHESGSLPA